jgi:hypothetical protein
MSNFSKKETTDLAHQNLIRSIANLEGVKSEYFMTADVCGGCKVWQASLKPKPIINFELSEALAYNSVVELKDRLPNKSSYKSQTLVACAVKSCKINIICIDVKACQHQ